MALLWGSELLLLYNDASRLILEGRHPGALGRPARDVWPGEWSGALVSFQENMLRESERQARAILDSLTEGVLLDAKGVVRHLNEAIQRMANRPLEKLGDPHVYSSLWLRRPDGTPFPPEEQPAVVALRTGEPVHDAEMSIPLSDGAPRWLSVDARPVRDALGTITGMHARRQARTRRTVQLDDDINPHRPARESDLAALIGARADEHRAWGRTLSNKGNDVDLLIALPKGGGALSGPGAKPRPIRVRAQTITLHPSGAVGRERSQPPLALATARDETAGFQLGPNGRHVGSSSKTSNLAPGKRLDAPSFDLKEAP